MAPMHVAVKYATPTHLPDDPEADSEGVVMVEEWNVVTCDQGGLHRAALQLYVEKNSGTPALPPYLRR